MCDKISISHFTKHLCGTPIYILVSSQNLWIHMMNVFLNDFINIFKLFLNLYAYIEHMDVISTLMGLFENYFVIICL
jgi:hypothetical protein